MTHPLSTPDFQDFVTRTLELWHAPGAAVTVLKDGEVIHSQGYGLRNREAALPVTPQTLFPIASSSKAFTAMTLALAVDAGKLDWDKPVREYLPTFRLRDPFASERMTGRDLLCHRSGLPRHDLLWYASHYNRQEIFDRLRYLEPSRDFRAAFQYQNIMYMVAGLLVGQLADMSWEEVVRHQIFDPLEMRRSNCSTTLTQQDTNFASPYHYRNEELRLVPFFEADDEKDAVGPAGSIISSVEEMAKWLAVHLNEGRVGDRQFVSHANLIQMHTPHIFIDDPLWGKLMGSEFTSYALGWMLHAHKGHKMIHHGGSIDGFASLVSFLPNQKVGVVVLSNGDSSYNPTPTILTNEIYDRLLNLPASDWNGIFKPIYDGFVTAGKASQQQSGEQRRTDAPPTHPLTAYMGEYEDVAYGVLRVEPRANDDKKLQLVVNDKLTLLLDHYHYNTFEGHLERFDMHPKLSFSLDGRGMISSVAMQMEPAVSEITFTRRPDRRLRDPALLGQFVGVYDYQGIRFTVAFQDENTLKLMVQGDRDRALLPYQGTEFNLDGLSGYSIRFESEGDGGGYTQAVISQPGALLTAKRV